MLPEVRHTDWRLHHSVKDSVVPCSDMAGEVIAVGSEVSEWSVGDRVCANFSPEHLYGDTSASCVKAEFGGASDGVLTQYKSFKPYVSSFEVGS